MPNNTPKTRPIIGLTIIAAVIVIIIGFNNSGLSLLGIVEQLRAQVAAQPLRVGLLFFVLYVVATAVSIPGAALLTMAAGALFGLFWGTLIVSFASTIGACLAFMGARLLFHDSIQARFNKPLSAINAGITKEGAYYLFTLRLVPLFPFFLINLLMGLTPLKIRTFYWVSQIGMLPATLVYVNAGAQASDINQVQDLVSAPLLLSFVLLGLFPLIAKRSVDWLKTKRRSN